MFRSVSVSRVASWVKTKRFFPGVRNPVFHATTGPRAASIAMRGEGIKSNSGFSNFGAGNMDSISLSRDLNFLLKGGFGNVIFVLDRDELNRKFPVNPHAYRNWEDEYEERVFTDKIPPSMIRGVILRYKPLGFELDEWESKVDYPVVYIDHRSREWGSRTAAAWDRHPDGRLLGFKVMGYDPEMRQLISGADSRQRFPLRKGVHRMRAPGIFLAATPSYVLDYYAGFENNALLTYAFDVDDVTTGNLGDREPEITVSEAELVDWSLYDEDMNPLRVATLSDSEREGREDEAQVRQSPKLKPPRTDKERRLVKDRDNAEDDPDMKQDQKDRSRNYKDAAARVALRYLLAASDKVPMYNTEAERVVLVSPETARAESGKYKEPTEEQLQQYQSESGSDESDSDEPSSDESGSDDPSPDAARPGGLDDKDSSAADAVAAAREARKTLTSEDEELWDIEDIRGAVGDEFKAIPGIDPDKVDKVLAKNVIVTPDGIYEPESLEESLFDSVSAQMDGPVDTRKVRSLLKAALSVEDGDKPDIESIKMAVGKALTKELKLGRAAERITDSIQLTEPRRYVGGLVRELTALDTKAVKQFDKKVKDARQQVLDEVEDLIGSSRQISDLPTSLLMDVAAKLDGSEGAIAESLLDSSTRSKIESKAKAADKVLEKASDEKATTPSADEIAAALIAKRTQSLADDPSMLNPAQPLSSLSLEPLKVREGDEGAFRNKMADRAVESMRAYLDMDSSTRSKHREQLEAMLTELDGDGHRETEQYAAAQAQLRGLAVASALEDGDDAKGVNQTMQKALQFARKDGRLDDFVRLNITGASDGDESAQTEIRKTIESVDSEDLKEMLPEGHPGHEFLGALNNETFLATMDSESQDMLRRLSDDMVLSEMIFTDMDLVKEGKSVGALKKKKVHSTPTTSALSDFFKALGITVPSKSASRHHSQIKPHGWDFAPWGEPLSVSSR